MLFVEVESRAGRPEQQDYRLRFLMQRKPFFNTWVIVFAGLALLLSGCQRAEELPMNEDRPHIAAGVTMRDVRFSSVALEREMPYRVFLPEHVTKGMKLPVVYLLHGRGPDFRDWSNSSDVSKYALQGLILVMPEGNSSFYLNAAKIPKDKYEDYLAHDLVADVERRFPAQGGRAHRAIIGISMGGFGAMAMALRHPDMYVFAGGLSAAIDVPKRRFNLKRAGQWWLFQRIFGPIGSEERAARDPFVLVKDADPRVTPYLYLTVGDKEPLLEPNRRFAAQLQGRGIAHEFHVKPGGHDWNEWGTQIPGCFERMFASLGTVARP
jgi:putative tributyrin esterase